MQSSDEDRSANYRLVKMKELVCKIGMLDFGYIFHNNCGKNSIRFIHSLYAMCEGFVRLL